MTYQTEFPDYPAADLPPLPPGAVDVSWRNDQCPSFTFPHLGLTVWADYADPDAREFVGEEAGGRFGVYAVGPDGDRLPGEHLADSDDFAEILAAMVGARFAQLVARDLAEHLPRIRAANRDYRASPKLRDCCATHDVCDANEIMADAMLDVVGYAPFHGDLQPEGPEFEAACDLWNRGWAAAEGSREAAWLILPTADTLPLPAWRELPMLRFTVVCHAATVQRTEIVHMEAPDADAAALNADAFAEDVPWEVVAVFAGYLSAEHVAV